MRSGLREVEYLFGAMPDFESIARRAVQRKTGVVVLEDQRALGAAIMSTEDRPHTIDWLSVRASARRTGVGHLLMAELKDRWPTGSVSVVTFGPDIAAGTPARRLYEQYGVVNHGYAPPGPDGGSRELYVLER